MLLSLSRPLWVVLSGWLAFSGSALAQVAPSLRDAVEAAWALSAQARAQQNHQAELDARARAVSALVSGPPSVALSHRTDRLSGNAGLRELEAELSVPLWSPNVRQASAEQVRADRVVFEQQMLAAKAKLVVELRELAALAALAQIERELAKARLQETAVLAADLQRRVSAGETARIDLLQVQSTLHQAASAQAQADSALARIQAQWRGLTGLPQVAALDETLGSAQEHSSIAVAEAQLRAAQAKLSLAAADQRDPMELALGLSRERSAAGSPAEWSTKFSLRMPLGSYGRNAPKLAAARAEVDAAEAHAQAARRTVEADLEAARAELEAARRSQTLAAQRERLAQEMHALIAKSYQLGESDLLARLRADSERFEAGLTHAKARVETRRAVSKLNQAFGVNP